MNSLNEGNVHNSTQDMYAPGVTNLSEWVFALPGLILFVSFVIFLIWIWSMLSMIMLNARFKDFYKDYLDGSAYSDAEDMRDSAARREVVVEPIREAERNKSKTKPFALHRGLAIFLLVAMVLALIILGVSSQM